MSAHTHQNQTLRQRIARDDVLLGDGAIGTALQQRGLPIDVAPESWNLDRPNDVRQVAADYFGAGADFVLTNTFGGNRVRLRAAGLGEQVDRVNTRAVELARSSAPDHGYVLGSIGPTGESLADDEYAEIFAEQVGALMSAGVDGFCVETVCSVGEGVAAARAIRVVSDRFLILSFTLRREDNQVVTLAGENLTAVVAAAEGAGADVLGLNCVGWDVARESACLLMEKTQLPLAVSPNAGVPETIGGRMSYPLSEVDLAERMVQLIQSGVRIVAGCCGTGPEYIETLRALVDRSKAHRQHELE